MLYIILSAFLSRLRGLLSSFHISIKLFDFKMANFLTKIIRKSGIRKSKFFFLKTAKPFFILLYSKYNNNNHSFSSSDERSSLLSFPAYIHFCNRCICKSRYSQFLISNRTMLWSHTSKLKKEKSLSLSF